MAAESTKESEKKTPPLADASSKAEPAAAADATAPPPEKEPAIEVKPSQAVAVEAENDADDEGTEEDDDDDVTEDKDGLIEMEVFSQLLDLDDDDDDRSFTRDMISDYYSQAKVTIVDMRRILYDDAEDEDKMKPKDLQDISDEDLKSLSAKGHFLKGSSAALGLKQVSQICEDIQHYGKQDDYRGEGLKEREDFIKSLTPLLVSAKIKWTKRNDEAEEERGRIGSAKVTGSPQSVAYQFLLAKRWLCRYYGRRPPAEEDVETI